MDNTNIVGLILFLWIVAAPTVGFALIGRGGTSTARPVMRARDDGASERARTDVVADRRVERERETGTRTG